MDVGDLEQKVSFAHVVKQWMMEWGTRLIDDGYKLGAELYGMDNFD
jgi:hypothetical protein